MGCGLGSLSLEVGGLWMDFCDVDELVEVKPRASDTGRRHSHRQLRAVRRHRHLPYRVLANGEQ